MKRSRFYLLCLLASTCVLFNGCKKEKKDTLAPNIEWTSPLANSNYSYGNQIQVKVHVMDNEHLESVIIELIDDAGASRLQQLQFQNLSSHTNVTATLTHDDPYLPTGIYNIRVTATDGENIAYSWREIHLTELAKSIEHIYIISDNGNSHSALDSIHSGGISAAGSLDTKPDFSFLQSRHSEFVVASNTENMIRNYDTNLLFLAGTTDSDPNGNATITASAGDKENRNFYFGNNEGEVWVLRETGEFNQAISNANSSTVRYIIVNDQFIYVVTSTLPGQNEWISVYQKSTGFLIHSLQLDLGVTGMIAIDNDHLLLSLDQEPEALITYNNTTNNTNSIFTFYNETPASGIWRGTDNIHYVMHDDGLTYYNTAVNNFVVHPGLTALDIQYEPLTNRVFIINENEVTITTQDLNTVISSYAVTGVRNVLFEYNK